MDNRLSGGQSAERSMRRSGRLTQIITTLCLFAIVSVSHGQSAEPAEASSWALLIGVEQYRLARPLQFTANDVQRLSETFITRGHFDPGRIRRIVDGTTQASQAATCLDPTREVLLTAIPEFLSRPGSDDLVIVYFSGHGFRDANGRLYLAPIDCDPEHAEATGISAEWFLNQVDQCPAKHKLLIIDACHAGSDKGENSPTLVAAKDLNRLLEDLPGVATLASSTGTETSLIWPEKRQSLFSYWLNQGLKGHADRNGDAQVTIDELYDYVHARVTSSAASQFHATQTPVRHIRTGIGSLVPVHLQPQPLDTILGDMAEQLVWALTEQKLDSVGVLEFTNDTKYGELLGADFGKLGQTCQLSLERQLAELTRGTDQRVISRRKLAAAIKSQELSIEDLGSDTALSSLAEKAGGMPAIAVGTLRNRRSAVVTLRCELLKTDSGEVAASVGGTARLSESQWAEVGISTLIRPEDRRQQAVAPAVNDQTASDALIDRLDEQASAAHPLLDPNFPYRIRIMVDRKERPAVFRGNDMFVPLRVGEVYEIWIENRTGRMTYMRLLVDGLNTLPQPLQDKGVTTMQIAAPVSLEYAKPWLLDPRHGDLVAVRGFFTQLGADAKYREFTVVDAQKSLAARQQFTDQLGLITAAFYAPQGTSRAIGTTGGAERSETVNEVAATGVGNLLAVVHIRYVEPEAIENYGR